jgi:hypothetical protein
MGDPSVLHQSRERSHVAPHDFNPMRGRTLTQNQW